MKDDPINTHKVLPTALMGFQNAWGLLLQHKVLMTLVSQI